MAHSQIRVYHLNVDKAHARVFKDLHSISGAYSSKGPGARQELAIAGLDGC